MNNHQKNQLVDALLQCPNLFNDSIRQDIIRELPDDIRGNIPARDTAYAHVNSIVITCLNYPEGLAQLIAILAGFERDSIPLQQVRRLVSDFQAPGIIKPEQRRRLFELITGAHLSFDHLQQLYHACRPEKFEMPEGTLSLWRMLAHLWDIPSPPDDLPPALKFAESTAQAVQRDKPDLSRNLQEWVDILAQFLSVEETRLRKFRDGFRNTAAGEAKAPPYLLVEIHPDCNTAASRSQTKYLVQISYWRSQSQTRYLHRDDRGRLLQDIPPLLDGILNNLARAIPDEMAALTVEFFMPRELISCEVDQWKKGDELLGEMKFGDQLRMAVRSLERAKNPALQEHWRQKWDYLQQQLETPANENTVRIYQPQRYRKLEFYNSLVNDLQLVCLGLTYTPTDQPGECKMLSELLRAGMPVAVWPRSAHWPGGTPPAEEFAARLQQILLQDRMSALPEIIRRQRSEASAATGTTHVGLYLTLLWDDPRRLPLEFIPEVDVQFQAL